MTLGLNRNAVTLLADVGFLGLSRGRTDRSEVIFDTLRSLRPDDDVGHIGYAMTRLSADDAEGAVAALKAARQSEAVIAFLCLATSRLGDKSGAQELRDELVALNAQADLIAIADAALAQGQG